MPLGRGRRGSLLGIDCIDIAEGGALFAAEREDFVTSFFFFLCGNPFHSRGFERVYQLKNFCLIIYQCYVINETKLISFLPARARFALCWVWGTHSSLDHLGGMCASR